jgi:thymidine kinase
MISGRVFMPHTTLRPLRNKPRPAVFLSPDTTTGRVYERGSMMMPGKLTVLTGPMFAGKTEALIERAIRIPSAFRRVYKPTTDTRQGDGYILSHGGESISALWVDPALDGVDPASSVFIDEAQFLLPAAIERVLQMQRSGTNLVLAGLDLDARGFPFGPMPEFLCLANEVVKLSGSCANCGRPSCRTSAKIPLQPGEKIRVGGSETYEPRCLDCVA